MLIKLFQLTGIVLSNMWLPVGGIGAREWSRIYGKGAATYTVMYGASQPLKGAVDAQMETNLWCVSLGLTWTVTTIATLIAQFCV